MKKIITTNNSVQLIDTDRHYNMIYNKGNIYFRVCDSLIHFYHAGEVAEKSMYNRHINSSVGRHEIFVSSVPIEINGVEYTTMSDLVDVLDELFKSTIDVQILSKSGDIENEILVVESQLKDLQDTADDTLAEFIKSNEKQDFGHALLADFEENFENNIKILNSDMTSGFTAVNQNLINIHNLVTTTNSKLSSIDTRIATLNTEVLNLKSLLTQQVNLLQQILDK